MTSYLHYKKQMAVLDADDIESWITVRGNHIPVKKGQSKEEAVKSFVEKKGESSSKSTKTSTGRFEVVGGNGVSHKKFETQEEAEKWAKENVNKLHTSLKVVGGYKKYKEYEPKKFAKAEPKEEKSEQKHVTIHTNKTFSDTMKRFSETYEELYKNEDKYTSKHYSNLVTEFDEKLKSNPVFKKQVQEFVKERGDVLSSDREVKAYMLATANTVTGVKESDNSLEFVRTDYSNNPYEIKADKDSITINGKKFNVKYNSEYHWKAKKGGNTIETSAENAIGLAKRLKNIDDANVGNLFLKALMGIQ